MDTDTIAKELAASLGAAHVAPLLANSWRVTPGTVAEIAEVIRRAAGWNAAIYPEGASHRRHVEHRGKLDPRPGIYISTQRLDQVLQLDETSLLVHAQAGLTGLELERILSPRGMSIGDYPPVVLTSFLLANREQEIRAGSILPAALGALDRLVLPYSANLFTIEFSALNFRQPEENRYAYKLEGLYDDWIATDSSNAAIC